MVLEACWRKACVFGGRILVVADLDNSRDDSQNDNFEDNFARMLLELICKQIKNDLVQLQELLKV